jgi:AcrR family transcriptional regulator
MFNHSKHDSQFCLINKLVSKREERRQIREQELLIIAEKIMITEGFTGLTMDKLVAACDYSKGTVYSHFNSKEDLLCALCIKGMRINLSLFSNAQTFSGNSREKLLAIHYAYSLHALTYPTLFMCVLASQTPAIREKADPERLLMQKDLDKELTAYCDKLFTLGIESGDLTTDIEVSQLTFVSWALSFGSNALITMASEIEGIQRLNTESALLQSVNLLMDGIGWKPLSSDWDYKASWQRIGQELFAQKINT